MKRAQVIGHARLLNVRGSGLRAPRGFPASRVEVQTVWSGFTADMFGRMTLGVCRVEDGLALRFGHEINTLALKHKKPTLTQGRCLM